MGAKQIVIVHLASLAMAFALAFAAASATPTNSPSAASEFDLANKLYEQGKFAEAAAAYEKLALGGAATPSIWFNLGNANYKSGQLGRAIAAYRLAERTEPRDASLRANLQFVRGKVYSDERAHVPLWKNTLRLATLNEWTVLTVGCFWALFSVLACGEIAGRRYTRTAILLLLATVLSGSALMTAWRDRHTPEAVVVAKEAAVRFGPLDESQSAFQLRDGAELTALAMKDNWLQVRDPEKRIGWIRRDEVALLGQ
jgi:tetratricopeptide (TPR) repeat protein